MVVYASDLIYVSQIKLLVHYSVLLTLSSLHYGILQLPLSQY